MDADDPLLGDGGHAPLELDLGAGPVSGGYGGELAYGGATLGDGLDDPLSASGPALELAIPEPRAKPPVRRSPLGPSGRPGSAPALRSRPAPSRPVPSRPVPSRSVPSRPAPPEMPELPADGIPEVEVLAAADYGLAPKGLFASVPYVLHVFNRRRDIQQALRDGARVRDEAARGARRALVALGGDLSGRENELGAGSLAAELEAVRRCSAATEESTALREQARKELEGRMGSLGSRLEVARAEVGPLRDRETKLLTQLKVREADLSRATARLKRVEIELRNLRSAPEPDEPRMELHEADRVARTTEVEAAKAPVLELTEALAPVRRELAAKLGRVNEIDAERRQLEATVHRTENVHGSSMGQANAQLEEALLNLGEQAMAQQLGPGPVFEAARAALEALNARERRHALLSRALGAYDKPAVQRGAAILGGAALLVLAMLLFILFR